jgi:hypothetical protein
VLAGASLKAVFVAAPSLFLIDRAALIVDVALDLMLTADFAAAV